MKKTYMTPRVETATLQGEIVMYNVSGGDTGMKWGGNASQAGGPSEADVNGNGGWNLWDN